MDTLSCSKSFFSKGHEVITDIAAIHSTTHVAASCLDGKIYVLDLHLERIGKALNGHKKGVTMLKYCANKGYLVSGGLDHCLSLWNPHVEQKIGSLKGHKHQLVGLEVVPGTPQVISSDESGLVKIWDLRMFAPLRSFKREVYVKDHTLPRTLTRPMRTMCYMASRKRIAIAHSSIFFVDLQDDELTTSGNHDRSATGFDVEERSKPLAVVFHRPSSSIVLITPREFQSWSTHSRTLIHREKMLMKVDATCVSMVEDHYSCIMGAEDGTIARAMLPRGSVILSKRLHSAEIAAVRWVNGSRQIVSSSFDGTVLISLSANLEVLHSLNHWQGIRSVSNNYASLYEQGPKGNDLKSRETQSTVENFIRLFNSVDYAQTGKITAQKAKELLDGAFMVHQHKQSSGTKKKAFSGREAITLTAFLKKAQTRLRDMQHASLSSNGSRGPDAVSIDVHSKLQHLVTVSPFDGTFCVWKLKGGSLVATGAIKKPQLETEDVVSRQPETRRLKTSLVGQVVYLDPLPYFVLVEEGHPSQLSIWSSTAIPSVFPYGHQRILCLQYGAESNAQCNETRASSRKYLQKPCEIAIICAALWMAQDTNCSSSLLCIGDDHGTIHSYATLKCQLRCVAVTGYVAIYEFDALIQEIEYLRELESSRETSRSERSNVSKVLPNSLVKLRCQWLSRKGDPVRVLSPIHQVGSSASLVAITHDSGATSFYTTEGVCVGDLFDRSIPWQLQIDQSDSNESNQIAAVKMLQDLKTHRRVSQTLQQRQSQVKHDRIRNAAIPTNRKNSEEYAKQRPGLSRFLAVANQL
ncbi:unnamed protein product [Phytophthora lilii]|uniref:Unnamed protein product n=1 Tax=Phytophthora lilii TaxID=2077276 RepID=A0A9W7CNE6_9STRA|nr:unnamed protein product [Phytophthora lilii]